MRGHTICLRCERDSLEFFVPRLARCQTEQLVVAHLDDDGNLLAVSETVSPHADLLVLPLRRILTDALAHDGRAMILAHNHPGGDVTPSKADIAATRTLYGLLRPLGIRLLDHLIVTAHGEPTSFRRLGWL